MKEDNKILVLVPVMLIVSSAIMAMAWLGHLKYKENLSFWMATLSAWLLVLPEYLLNISAIRWGVKKYTPSQMAAMNLSSGVIFIAIVSHYFLGEELTSRKYIGFVLMTVAMVLITGAKKIEKKRKKIFAETS